MSASNFPPLLSQFSGTLRECRELYVSSGQQCALEYPHLLSKSGDEFVQLMDDLHRALVLKIYFAVCEADKQWSMQERLLAEELFLHLWGERLQGERLRIAAKRAAEDATKLQWTSLVRPFDTIAPLRDRIGELDTVVMRLANVVARADGHLHPQEMARIQSIQDTLHQHLRAVPIDEPNQHQQSVQLGAQAIEQLHQEADDIRAVSHVESHETTSLKTSSASGEKEPRLRLEDAMAELNRLIGLEKIQQEVRTLTNFLKFQQRREQAGLPGTEISLHMIFTGNPGTGKTTVARIIGKIFGAMGILKKGHLVETDRSGLVAEYAGQTGPKTNAKIDEALDGLLFIDEAYSLIANQGEDPFGHEAVQALLKRAEDERRRLVVILAGYPHKMERLLKSNPGLSSRFSRRLHFDDYSPVEMARIFGLMCDKNRYDLTSKTRAKLVVGLTHWFENRDEHFGNGRAVRNLFEQAIRHMANRIANVVELSEGELTLLEATDIDFPRIPPSLFRSLQDENQQGLRFQIACTDCGHDKDVPAVFLGKRIRCPKCEHDFVAAWGELLSSKSTTE